MQDRSICRNRGRLQELWRIEVRLTTVPINWLLTPPNGRLRHRLVACLGFDHARTRLSDKDKVLQIRQRRHIIHAATRLPETGLGSFRVSPNLCWIVFEAIKDYSVSSGLREAANCARGSTPSTVSRVSLSFGADKKGQPIEQRGSSVGLRELRRGVP